MTRTEVVNFLNKQFKRLPDEEALYAMTPSEVRNLKVDFEPARKWLQGHKLKLASHEIQATLFQILLYFVLDFENDDCHYFPDDKLLSEEVQDEMLKILENYGTIYNMQSLSLSRLITCIITG